MSEGFLESIKQSYYPDLVEKMNIIQVKDFMEGKYLMKELDMSLSMPHIDDIKLYFDQKNNGVTLDLENIDFELNGKVKFSVFFIKLRTSFELKGTFSKISTTFAIEKQPKNDSYIPAVDIKKISTSIRKDSWELSHRRKIYRFFLRPLKPIIREVGMPIFEDAVKGQIRKLAPNFINKEIYKSVEILAELDPWLLINVGFVGEVKITEDTLYLPIDGTIVTPKQPSNDSHEAPKLPLKKRDPDESISIIGGEFLLNTLADALSLYSYDFDLEIDKYEVILHIPKRQSAINITNSQDGIHFLAKGYTTINNTNIAINSTVEGNLKFYFKDGDDNHLVYLVARLDRESFKVKTYGWELIGEEEAMDWVDQIFGPITYVSDEKVDLAPHPIERDMFVKLLAKYNGGEYTPNYMSFGFIV